MKESVSMTVERSVRALAGVFVLASVALGYFVHPGYLVFTAFVGANLLQSAFTDACPAMTLFRKAGLPACVPARAPIGSRRQAGA